MRGFLIGLLVGILLVPAGVFLYLRSGYAPAATAAAPFPMEKRIASMALKAHIDKEAPAQAGIPLTEDALVAGAKLYVDYCLVCHGGSTGSRSAIAAGMYPQPPQLLHGKGVTDDPVGETYWKVANGIRLTGMPAYRNSVTDTQLWQVSLLLANADKLPPAASSVLAAAATVR